jgi:hypothetical protein
MSPLEHQATPITAIHETQLGTGGNFDGWMQYRATFKNQKTTKYEPTDEEVASWNLKV